MATGDIAAFASDARLKANVHPIDSPLERLRALRGVFYEFNDLARSLGLGGPERRVGVLAQDAQRALPETVRPAPFDVSETGGSRSGQGYLTVQYDKLVPLLIEAVLDLDRRLPA
jgi:hypothetical protein